MALAWFGFQLSPFLFPPVNNVRLIPIRLQELFAIAGVTKRIKLYDYQVVLKDTVDIHYPCIEMVCGSKISCVSWSSFHKSTLASSDYDCTVVVWDASTAQKIRMYQVNNLASFLSALSSFQVPHLVSLRFQQTLHRMVNFLSSCK